jgi:uncharacterized damage-inducible protein DinB
MAYTLENILTEIEDSRKFFLRHLNGVTAEQWDWKPYAECKSIRDTVYHVVGTEDWTIKCLTEGAGSEIFFDCVTEATKRLEGKSAEKLITAVIESRERIYTELRRHIESPLDTPIKIWGEKQPIGSAVAHLSSEDYYHAGQVAFIRMATDPTWNYYQDIYGG